MGKTAKDCCPNCKTKFHIGGLPSNDELAKFRRLGVVSFGESAEEVTCPKCTSKLKVAIVRMGNFFSTVE